MLLRQLLVIFVSLHNNVLADIEGYIVGGEHVPIEKYPHAAFLDVICPTAYMYSWVCGGSIINQYFTLTAAHCVFDCKKDGYISVTVGHAHKKRGFISSVYKYKAHKDFTGTSLLADIALTKLKSPVEFGEKVKRIILMRYPPIAKVAYVSGWGVVDEEKDVLLKWLKHTSQTIWPIKECKKKLYAMPAGTFCAAGKPDTDYAASGDSGSGLVINDCIQIGLVSYKEPQTDKSLVVYVNISYYYDWILENTKRLHCG